MSGASLIVYVVVPPRSLVPELVRFARSHAIYIAKHGYRSRLSVVFIDFPVRDTSVLDDFVDLTRNMVSSGLDAARTFRSHLPCLQC